jgi:hypothetical protein
VSRISELAQMVGCSRSTVKAALASDGPPRYVRAATGSLVDGFGAVGFRSSSSRSQDQQRQDRHVHLTNSIKKSLATDKLSYGLSDTAVDGFWIGSNLESAGEAPLAGTLASIMDSTPYDGVVACAEEESDQLQMILGRPRPGGREPQPSRESPDYHKVPRRCERP